nr:ribonuclease H-like domain-containing protein [Tanacetum cinerariifolium]
ANVVSPFGPPSGLALTSPQVPVQYASPQAQQGINSFGPGSYSYAYSVLNLYTPQVSALPQAFHTMIPFLEYGHWSIFSFGRQCSTGELYPVTQQPLLQTLVVLLSFSSTTWHRRLGHPGDDVLRRSDSNDIILTASSSAFLQRIIASLHSEFAMTDLVSLNYFLGISAERSASGLFLSQSKFAEEILERAHMQNCNPCRTPVDTESKLGSDGDPIYLYMHDPHDPHFTALKRILRYVRGNLDYGLQLHVSSTTQLSAYTDADWEGCAVTRQSTSEYCVFLGDNLLSWSTKRQITLSRSSAEAEYRGVSNVVVETAWTIDIHFVRDYVASGQVRVLHVPSWLQYADIFTKGLPTALFLEFRSSLNVRRPSAHTAGE